MATPLFFDNAVSVVKVLDANQEISVQQEIILADYDAPVFKIVKTTMEQIISQKYISQNKLTAEGFIKICIYYQPPENQNLSVISQKIPFQKQIDLTLPVNEVSFINITGQPQYVNTRAQNSTRIEVRGAYLLNFKAYSKADNKLVTAIKSPSVFTDEETLNFFTLSGQGLRLFNIEDELALEEGAEKIIRIQTNSENMVTEVFSDKVTVKGELLADILYCGQESDEIKKYTKSFAYNQIIDIKGTKENSIAYSDLSVVSFTVTQSQESQKLVANLTVQLDVKIFAKQQIIALNDAFSTKFESEKTEELVPITANITAIDKVITVNIEDKFSKEYKLIDALFEIAQPKSYFEINKTTVKAKITAHVIAKNIQNEYECFSKTEDILLDWLEDSKQHDEIIADVSFVDYSYQNQEGELKIKAKLAVKGFVLNRENVNILQSFNEIAEKPLAKLKESLIIYYAQKDESVFDIAKAHRAPPKAIMEDNALADKLIPEDKMLFIPAFEN